MDSSQAVNAPVHTSEVPTRQPFRKWLYSLLLDPHISDNHHKRVDKWIGLLIVANLFAFKYVSFLNETLRSTFGLVGAHYPVGC